MSNNFLVSGMFRSGTTMFARMLHANPNIVCASDPYAPIYKSYRNNVMAQLAGSMDPQSPLHDYYFDRQQNHLYQKMKNQDFSLSIARSEIVALRHQIEAHCKPYSPRIIPHLDKLNGSNYSELFSSAMEIIHKAYGKSDETITGCKEVWSDEFAPHFMKMQHGNKVIHLIRDPRSVVASNFASGATYPLIFLIRQWRKIASLAWMNSQKNENAMLIKFEDLVSRPEVVARNVCKFLEVDFHQNMVKPSSYLGGDGKPWVQNTSYDKKPRIKKDESFNKVSLDKWKQVLNEDVLRIIDKLCSFEMKLLGYLPVWEDDISGKDFSILGYQDDLSNCAEWIKPYANYDNFKELSAELMRLDMIQSENRISKEMGELLVLDLGILDYFA